MIMVLAWSSPSVKLSQKTVKKENIAHPELQKNDTILGARSINMADEVKVEKSSESEAVVERIQNKDNELIIEAIDSEGL